MKALTSHAGLMFLLGLVTSCIEPYDPPLDNQDLNFLVVSGHLNASTGTATVTLRRTVPVQATTSVPTESGAIIVVQDSEGASYFLSEEEAGLYQGNITNPDLQKSYRLFIRTKDNREYASEFVEIVTTPPIDSITYGVTNEGLEFSVNTHDPSGSSRNYRWKFSETYEYRSSFNSVFIFDDGEILYRTPEQWIHTCWRTNLSTDLVVASTKHLKESVVNRQPVQLIPYGSVKLSVKYSLLVEQQALSDEAYEYWLNLEKSTEHLGGLFDPLPVEVSGNVHSNSSSEEKVLGYFSASTVSDLRRTVSRHELPREISLSFSNNPDCELDTILVRDLGNVTESTTLVDAIYAPGAGLIGYTSSSAYCADCRTQGGVTTKPSFWE